VLSDPTVSRFHLELRRDQGRIQVLDLGSTNGTQIGAARLSGCGASVPAGTAIELGETRICVEDGAVVALEGGPEELGGIRGKSPALRRLLATIARVARTDVPVLLFGESGTGKELVARAVHDGSPRAAEPFVTLDCAAIAPTLFASELFGHERGAFTGAERQHIGAFERAHGGTLFLDEIGELGPELQAALLGVLERRRLRRVGGQKDVEIDARLVCATHRDLRSQVNAGNFRLDLFYRIAVVLLEVPPLRERPADIPVLIEHFLREAGHAGPMSEIFSDAEMRRLMQHSWPGNVRELRNVVLGTLALGDAPALSGPEPVADSGFDQGLLELSFRDAKRRVVDGFERAYVEALLARTGGNIRQAAREAHMDRSYLMELIKRHRR
jgi:DNA-binding NtrC family response regulator